MRALYDTCVKYHYKYSIQDQDTASYILKYLESSGEIPQYVLSRERITYILMFGSFPPMELSPLSILLSAGNNEIIKKNALYNKLTKNNETGFNTLMWNYITNRERIDYQIFERLLCESPNDIDRFYANSAFKNFINSGFKNLLYHISFSHLDPDEVTAQSKAMSSVVKTLISIYKQDIDITLIDSLCRRLDMLLGQ